MTLFRHPSHFSQLEMLENAQRLGRQRRLGLRFDLALLIWDITPQIVWEQGVHCKAYMSNSEMRRVWKSAAPGSGKNSLFICLHTVITTRNKQIFITLFHKQSTHAPLYSYQGMQVRWARKLTLMDQPVRRHFVLLISTSPPFSRRSNGWLFLY